MRGQGRCTGLTRQSFAANGPLADSGPAICGGQSDDDYVSVPGKTVKYVKTRYVFIGKGKPLPFYERDEPPFTGFYCPYGYGECEDANGCCYPGRCSRSVVRGGQGRDAKSIRETAEAFVWLFIAVVGAYVVAEFVNSYLIFPLRG